MSRDIGGYFPGGRCVLPRSIYCLDFLPDAVLVCVDLCWSVLICVGLC